MSQPTIWTVALTNGEVISGTGKEHLGQPHWDEMLEIIQSHGGFSKGEKFLLLCPETIVSITCG